MAAGGRAVSLPQRPVHSLMAAVLLRVAGLDEHRANSQLDPPHGQPGQPARGQWSGERWSVVGEDRCRQAIAAERFFEDRQRTDPCRRCAALAGQKEPTEAIGHRQRIAQLAVAGAKLSFEVRRPQVVGVLDPQLGLARRQLGSATLARLDQTVTLEQRRGRARRRPGPARMPSPQPHQKLAGTPKRMRTALGHQGFLTTHLDPVRAAVRAGRTISQPVHASLTIAARPLVPRLAADPVDPAQLGHRVSAARHVRDEAHPLVHGRRLLPRHRLLLGDRCSA